jgi:hypothetical protein
LNISLAVIAWADDHAIFFRFKDLPVHFSPSAEILFSSFSVSEHTNPQCLRLWFSRSTRQIF